MELGKLQYHESFTSIWQIFDLMNMILIHWLFCTFSASSVSVRLGSSNHASGGEVIDVAQVIPHPNYDDFDISNDACILILENTPTNGSSE